MGRYYEGDIYGKFAFGSQGSNAADRFGVVGVQDTLNYYFDISDLEVLETELHSIEDSFKDHKLALITYYDLFNLDHDHQTLDYDTLDFHQYISKAGLSPLNSEEISEYNDYHLGRKILKSIKDHGSCSFTAEL